MASCYNNMLWLKRRIKNFQKNQHLNQPKWFKSSNELFNGMTIYGLSCRLGRSLKQKILEYQGQRDHRNDLNLVPLCSDGETEAHSNNDRCRVISSVLKTAELLKSLLLVLNSKKIKDLCISPVQQRHIASIYKYSMIFTQAVLRSNRA